MAAERKREVLDVYLSDKDMKKLRQGYVTYRMAKGHNICIRPAIKDRATVKKIATHRQKIRELQKLIGANGHKK